MHPEKYVTEPFTRVILFVFIMSGAGNNFVDDVEDEQLEDVSEDVSGISFNVLSTIVTSCTMTGPLFLNWSHNNYFLRLNFSLMSHKHLFSYTRLINLSGSMVQINK